MPEIRVRIQPSSEPICGGGEGPTAERGQPRWCPQGTARLGVEWQHEQRLREAQTGAGRQLGNNVQRALRSPQTPLKTYEHRGEQNLS